MEPPARRSPWLAVAAVAVVALVAFRWLGGADGGGERVALTPAPGGAASAAEQPAAAGRTAPAGGGDGGVWVHVAGAVRSPGVYRVPRDARVAQAVELAGGATRRANLAGVNLAAPLADGQQVVVPTRERTPAGGGAGEGAGAPAPSAGAAGAAGAGGAEATISLSTATVEQLETLDGIGPTLARRIVEYRESRGGFRSIGELREVEGIGDKRFEALRRAVRP